MRTRWPFSRSLLYPLTAVLVALAVLPVGLAGWAFVTSNREQVATLEKQYLTRQAVGLAREVQMFFLDSVGRIEAVAQVLRPSAGRPLEGDAASALLTDVVRRNPNLILLRLLDASGRGPFVQTRALSASAEAAIEPLLGAAFAANLQGKPVRRDLLRLEGEAPLVLVSLPLVGSDGKVGGAMQGIVSLAGVASRVAEESGRGVTVDVVDDRGEVVFSNDAARVGKSARAHPLVAQFLDAPVRLTKTYRDPLRPADDEELGSLCPVETPPWAVVTARDVEVAFAAVHSMAQRTALLALATGLVATLAGVVLARRITSPLRHLAEVTTSVAEGDFSRRVPVRSHNELGQLADNFNVMAAEIGRTIGSLHDALHENQELLVDSIRALAAAIDAKSPYTRGHSERVSRYAMAIAQHYGMGGNELKKVEIAALLHDVGKIGIEDAILGKPDALTEPEFAQMRAHPLKGAAIVSPIKRLKDMLPGIRSHHENWGGGGYPDGLVGEQIPLIARIIAAADVFDAMTTHRPYQRAISLELVLKQIRSMSGSRFDPGVVDAFFAAVEAGDLIPLGRVEVA
ncbi:MAG TPA: HD domain-containing phosphohydrolase [Thermoanaerobaculaceae bacterium]|nr:HD domain-containing phosphohydrolase [Thermoanaerobaculaceae bacterium]